MSKRKQVATASQERGGTQEHKHVKKPRLSGKSEEQQASSSGSSSSSSAEVSPLPSAAAQLAQAQAEIKQMKLKHAAEVSQLMSDKTELERKVVTLRR